MITHHELFNVALWSFLVGLSSLRGDDLPIWVFLGCCLGSGLTIALALT